MYLYLITETLPFHARAKSCESPSNQEKGKNPHISASEKSKTIVTTAPRSYLQVQVLLVIYVPLASQKPFPIMVYFVANYKPLKKGTV